jgi:ribosome-binding factor A
VPKDFSRTRRVAEQIQRELAELIRREVRDPRLGMVTVTAVEVSRDMSHAKVFVTVLGKDETESQVSINILTKLAGYLRHELGQSMRMRMIPELRFVYDSSIEHGQSLSALIDSLNPDASDE